MRGTWGSGVGDWRPYAVKISWKAGVNVLQTGFHLRAATLEIGSPEEVATEVQAFVDEAFKTILSDQDQILGVDVVNLVTKEGFSTSPPGLFGTMANNPNYLPSFVAAVVSLKGELRTRYGQGRMFYPVRLESATGIEVITASGAIAIQAVIDEMATRWIGNAVTGYNLVNLHGVLPARPATPSSPIRPEIPASWYDVTSMRLNTNLTFLRSRKAGVGS